MIEMKRILLFCLVIYVVFGRPSLLWLCLGFTFYVIKTLLFVMRYRYRYFLNLSNIKKLVTVACCMDIPERSILFNITLTAQSVKIFEIYLFLIII